MLTFSQAPYSFKDERNNLPTVFPGHCSFSFEQAGKLLKFVDPITLPFTGVSFRPANHEEHMSKVTLLH